MTTSRTNTVGISGPAGEVSLGELRWLVNQLHDGADTLKVRVKVDNTGHQLDPGSTHLTADVPDRQMLHSHHRPRAIKDSPQA